MSSSGGIHAHLLKLHQSLSDEDPRAAALKSHDIVGDLFQECLETTTENKLAFQTSLLFSKELGLLSFLRKSLGREELRDTRVEVLSFLEKFLDRVSPRVKGWDQTYATDITDTCTSLYSKEKGAKCRAAVLELLLKILHKTKASSVAADLRIGEMFNRYYGELCQGSKLQDSVLGKVYELLGVLAEVHPSDMVDHSDKLYRAYLGALKEQMTSATREPKLLVVAGCLRGLSALMVNFPKTKEEDPTSVKEIFHYALKTIRPQMEMNRYAVTFAGLQLLAKHASQFSSFFMDHYRNMFEVMSKLCGHVNPEMKKTSSFALEAFLKQIALQVAADVEEHKSVLKFFMHTFCGIIKTMDSTYKELSIAIRGYGFFAAPCKKVCPQDVDLMYTELIQRCKIMYLTESDGDEDGYFQLPSFLDSIASILIHLDKVPEVYTPTLERLLVVQVESFPQYSEKMQSACCKSILKVLVAMASKGPVMWGFISSVVYQGLIRVCSKPIVLEDKDGLSTESSEVRVGKWKVPSSHNYLPLYKTLLSCDRLKDSGFLDGSFESLNSGLIPLSRLVYDMFVKSVLQIVSKLDLSVQKVSGEESPGDADHVLPSSDPTAHLLPNKTKDFTAFINLVDFCSELLLKEQLEYFRSWLYPLSHELVFYSIRSPLVSGFYKLLSAAMMIAKKIKYFQGVDRKGVTSPQTDPVRDACLALFSKFGKEVCAKMKQYKDELLASCLTFVLSLHHSIIAADIKAYCPALEVALKLGLSHVPLADAALDALESWSANIPPETMQPCFSSVLPLLDGYLKSHLNHNKDDGVWEVMSSVSSTSHRGYNRVMTKLLKKSSQLVTEEAPFVMVRMRVVKLLGRLGGKINRNLVTGRETQQEMMKKFVAWDSERRLSFAVPFADMKPLIYLDPFLPRICELALSTTDRQTKVVACELLHSLVIYTVGKNAQIVEGENTLPPMYKLHKRLFPVLMRLACDVDQVTRQLFEPLVMQLIHWFTNNKKFESQDTVAVLEAIMDGLVDPVDSTLRDFSGRCIEEFVKWSIKQTTPKQQERSPTNMKSLFKRIYSLALHPNGFRRLGAALAFNSVYRLFREESSLVDQFVFEVLVIFVESLALAHSDEQSLGTVQQCGGAIDHLQRIVQHKCASLNQPSAQRRRPRSFPAEGAVCLSDVVLWLLEQCGRPQAECRHKCMQLFYEFAPLLPGRKSLPQWLDGMLKSRGGAFLTSAFEGGGLLSQPTLRDRKGPFSVRATLQWMDLLLASLDCYTTFISLHILKPPHMISLGESSRFLKAVHFFLTELATRDLSAAERRFQLGKGTSHFSPREMDQYNFSKCTITVRLLEFSTMVLTRSDQDLLKLLEKDVFIPAFFELVAAVVCEPSTVGFNMADVVVMKNLPDVCVAALKALLTSPYHTLMESSIREKVSQSSVEKLCAVDLNGSDSAIQLDQLEPVLSACQQIHKAGYLSSILNSQDASYAVSLGSGLLMMVFKGIAPGQEREALPSLDSSTKRLADGLLQLAFSLNQQGEQLVDLLLNTLTVPGGQPLSHGEYFYSLFKSTINTELLKNLEITVPLIMKASSGKSTMVSMLLNGLLDYSFRERSVRATREKTLVKEILGGWECFRSWWDGPSATPETKTATILLLSKLLQIDSSACSDINHSAFRPVFSTFTGLLVDKSFQLNLKSQALLVLPFFTMLPEELLAELQSCLDTLVVSHFPIQSDEFAKGSLHRNNYMDCIRKLLDALELSQSPLLLRLMAGVLCRDRRHIMEEQFQNSFQKIAKRASADQQLRLLRAAHQVVQTGQVPLSSLLQAMERVVLPLAKHCSSTAIGLFFVSNICDISAVLFARFTKTNVAEFEVQILKKIGCYKLMELMYSRLPKEEVYSKESCINRAYCRTDTAEGNELSKSLIKSCFEAFTENMSGETQLLELRRLYHCAAYNCAVAAISCSFSEPKFFTGFLFSEKPEKNQFILENIIDVKRTYNFPVEIEVPLERSKKYVAIRKAATDENEDAPVYLSSQSFMSDSSLSEEMSQFDFSTGVQSFSFSSQKVDGQRRNVAKKEPGEETIPSQDAVVDLEMDELNQHECMAALTGLIGHMHRNNITPKTDQEKAPAELPPWMKYLHTKLSNPTTHLNIRLFVAKMIINTEEVFRPYAKYFLGPLIQLVVCGDNGGDGIHFMVVDIVVTVLSWTGVAKPKGNPRDEVLANRLLEFLMKHSFHSNRAVFRHNLQIIRTLVECWKDCLHVPYSLIYERFCGTDGNNKDNSVGLQLLGIILANNLAAYDPSCGVAYTRYIQALTNNVTFVRYKDLYAAAAEIIGLMLKNLTHTPELHQELLSMAVNKIGNLKRMSMDDKFIICLNKVSKHFPPFMDRFVNHLFFLLPKSHGFLKTSCLECVLGRAEVIPDVFLQLKTSGFIQTMGHREEMKQRVCLDIVHKIVALLTPEELQEVLGPVTAFISHPSPVCRERMYDILMWILDNYSDEESMEDGTSVRILDVAKESLLQGLSEENQGLQLYVRNFWSQEKRLPAATLERMLAVLQSLYSSKTEKCFLSLATDLLLEMTSQSPDFQRHMFEYPLSECTFQDYRIDSNWRVRSTVMTPMFVETLNSQAQESVASQPGTMKGKLRATQTSLEFSQTQTGHRTAYNWLTGRSMGTLAEYSLGSESASSLMVFDKDERRIKARKPVGEGFGTKLLSGSSEQGGGPTTAANEQRSNILALRRRFLKDRRNASLAYAQKEIQQQRRKKEEAADKRLQKEVQVTLYRNYRVGDFPDIQISYSSLITPLQALAQRDPVVAKQLFSSLFAGILEEMEKQKPRKEVVKIKEELQQNMCALLSRSTLCFPPFVACVQDMCYHHKDLQQLNPALVSSTSLLSLQQPLGVLLLEESLVHHGGLEEPPSKRSRGHKEIPPDTNKWIHLARLYRSMEDYDVVRGIFGGKVGIKPITCAALQAEASSDYAEAVKLYNEALNTEQWSDGEPAECERDFWEMAAMEAYSHLTDWKSLQYCSTVYIDEASPPDLQRMWSEPVYQEMYLPHMIRSMLKQLQVGERDQSLLSFTDEAMSVEERKDLLESQYSQELGLLYILQEDYDRASYYTNYAFELFLQNYSSVDSLMTQSRLTMLKSVQALTEIQEFLLFIKGGVSVSSVKQLIGRWTERYPDPTVDPMSLWDDIVTSRCFFLDQIKRRMRPQAPRDSMEAQAPRDSMEAQAPRDSMEAQAPRDSMEVDGSDGPDGTPAPLDTLINECKFSMKLQMADSAWKQNNFAVATKLLKELQREARRERGRLLRWVHSFCGYAHKRSRTQGPVEQIGAMLRTVALLEDLQTESWAVPAVSRCQQLLQGTSFTILVAAVSKSPSVLGSIEADKAESVANLAGVSWPTRNLKEVEAGLRKKAWTFLSDASRKADEEVQSCPQDCVDTSSITQTYMALANFCDGALREHEQGDAGGDPPDLLVLPVHLVDSLLKALKMNSEEARLKFARLLQIIELYPAETLDLMTKEMMSVPCWMLISWISQMVALLDKPEGAAVQHCLEQIANSFPQALAYALMISSESFQFQDSVRGHKQREFVSRLRGLLDQGGAVKNFVDALMQLANPEMIFKDWWDSLKNEMGKQSFTEETMRDLYKDLFSSLGHHTSGQGTFHKKFLQRFAKEVEKLLGPNGVTLFQKRRDKSLVRRVDELAASMRGFQKEPGNLKEYSPRLSGFKADTLGNELEVPGQYDGRSKPLPEYHAKITGFDERVKVMASMRRPKRLIIRGDDERDHPVLVKSGEDLRQDQRIEQLFSVMNIVLSNDAACAQRGLQLRTYQVIPLTTRIGLIEWMENTCTLKDFLCTTMTAEEQCTAARCSEVYNAWLATFAPRNTSGVPLYGHAYRKAGRAEAVNNFVKVVQRVPSDLLKRAFLKMSSSPEAFLSLRSHFARSHALLCVSHWLLGIGDRHLSNFMVNTESGGIIGIDFGHAFGSATQFLPVPELMPFRLTQQFVNLMQPLRESGLIQSVMVHSLRAYGADPDLLLNTMDVFVKEPLLDWKNFELKQLKKGGTWTEEVNTRDINWYPLQKVAFARRKLQGANPAAITSDELKLGFENDGAFAGMQAVALGSRGHNVRATLPPSGLSVEDQVRCLLDQAMDPNVLGRVWAGWEPWM